MQDNSDNEEADSNKDRGVRADVEALGRSLIQEKERSEELLTRLNYLQADFENYRKRVEKEIKDVGYDSAKDVVLKMLSVLDELDLAVAHTKAEKGATELKEGVRMVYGNLASALESAGLERIEAVGTPFDPAFHEATEKVEGTSAGEDMVVEEIRPGYTFRGRVIRPSLVKVELALKAHQEAKAK